MEALAAAQSTVRDLNDQLRQFRTGGTVLVTRGLRALGDEMVTLTMEAVARFDAFGASNDPYEEHDFGAVQIEGHTVFFKIDAYDRDLRWQSPDPTDPAVTCRVMTLMLAEEY